MYTFASKEDQAKVQPPKNMYLHYAHIEHTHIHLLILSICWGTRPLLLLSLARCRSSPRRARGPLAWAKVQPPSNMSMLSSRAATRDSSIAKAARHGDILGSARRGQRLGDELEGFS